MKEDREELVRLRKELRIVQEERDILKKRRRTSRRRADEGYLHRGEEGRAYRDDSLPVFVRDAQWLLRVAGPP